MTKTSPVRAARRRLGLSRDELGRILHVSGRTVSYWESGRKRPGPGHADALQKTLGLSEADLWHVLRRKPLAPAAAWGRRKPW